MFKELAPASAGELYGATIKLLIRLPPGHRGDVPIQITTDHRRAIDEAQALPFTAPWRKGGYEP